MLQERFPDAFEEALFCAWFAAQLPPVWQELSIAPAEYNTFLLEKAVYCCQISAAAGLLFRTLNPS